MDPSLPSARALAVAGDRVAGGVGAHETALPTPDVVDLGGRCVLPGFTDSHVHFPTWSLSQHDVRLEGVSGLAEALERVRTHPRRGSWIRGTGWRSAEWETQPTSGALDEVTGDAARDALVEGLPLGLAQLLCARPRVRRPPGDGRCGRARRERRTDRSPARGVGLAVPRSLRDAERGRVRRRDARGSPDRREPRRHGDSRQGRLARRTGDLPARRRARRAHASRLAVDPVRASPRARGARRPLRDRRRLPPNRVPEGVHGRDAGIPDRMDARRLRRRDHERRGARRGHPGGRPRSAGPSECTRSETARTARRSTPSRRRATCGPRSGCGIASSTHSASPPKTWAASPRSASRAPSSSATHPRIAISPSASGPIASMARTRSARSGTRARSSRTARTLQSRSSTRSRGSGRACCARSTSGRRGIPSSA